MALFDAPMRAGIVPPDYAPLLPRVQPRRGSAISSAVRWEKLKFESRKPSNTACSIRPLPNPSVSRSYHTWWRWGLQHLGFRLLPFGVDFTRHRWFFFHPTLGIGRFVAEAGRSRWRDTETARLHYEVSRLPGPVRALLYDEVKVLSPSLCLGIGGINAPRGRGDHFFFALVA